MKATMPEPPLTDSDEGDDARTADYGRHWSDRAETVADRETGRYAYVAAVGLCSAAVSFESLM